MVQRGLLLKVYKDTVKMSIGYILTWGLCEEKFTSKLFQSVGRNHFPVVVREPALCWHSQKSPSHPRDCPQYAAFSFSGV